jgi:hypothetical protein
MICHPEQSEASAFVFLSVIPEGNLLLKVGQSFSLAIHESPMRSQRGASMGPSLFTNTANPQTREAGVE